MGPVGAFLLVHVKPDLIRFWTVTTLERLDELLLGSRLIVMEQRASTGPDANREKSRTREPRPAITH